jgi:ubiquitin carboxyl-terminal hydrolase 8
MASVSSNVKSPVAGDYFAQAVPARRNSTSARSSRASIPEGDTITVQNLVSLMQMGSREVQILLLDVRPRQEFDEGHIMSQSIVCIEPDVVRRDNISASQISESLVLAPASEARLFDSRHNFDVVVFYDQETQKIRRSRGSQAENAILGLYNALSLYDFGSDGESKKPKLLEGGIDAWTNVMGSALQTSSTAGGPGTKPTRPAVRRSTLTRPATKYVTKPIQDPAEAKRWEESLNDLDDAALVRSTDDFLRRYPPPQSLQESMTSPVDKEVKSHRVLGHIPPAEAYASALPSPPTRPAPAVPRPSHSGLMENDEDDHYVRTMMANATKAIKQPRKATGLDNPGNWCYANSSLQAVFASLPFADTFISGDTLRKYPVPMKKGEKIAHPQLLCKIMANLFHWMRDGNFPHMKAKTLMVRAS